MNIKSISFRDLVPLSMLIEKYAKSPSILNEFFIVGIRKKILFYAVNQSDKYVHMVFWGEIEIDHPPYMTRIYEKEKKFFVLKGKMLPIAKIHHFDKLYKGVLNEIDLFQDIEDYHELVEYQQNINLFYEYATESSLTSPIEFKNIEFKHVYIEARSLEVIVQLLQKETPPKATKQTQRESVFLDWLNDKDELVISNMKKDDVWEELRNLDPHLFVSGHKAFFRVQQIITFKPGRKSEQSI
jgi:hypothetical protein